MALFRNAEEHRDNPPQTWEVVKVIPGRWDLRPHGAEYPIASYTRKRDAEADKTSGPYVKLYDDFTRWYAEQSQ